MEPFFNKSSTVTSENCVAEHKLTKNLNFRDHLSTYHAVNTPKLVFQAQKQSLNIIELLVRNFFLSLKSMNTLVEILLQLIIKI